MLARGLFLRQYLRWCASKASKLSSTDCGHVALDAGEVYNDALFAARARCLIVRRSVWVRHQLRRRDRVVCVVAEMHDCLVPAGPKKKEKKMLCVKSTFARSRRLCRLVPAWQKL